jgi:hypothetical protein
MIKEFGAVFFLLFSVELSSFDVCASTRHSEVDTFAVNDSLKTLINEYIENDSDAVFFEKISDWCETKNDSFTVGIVLSEQASALIDSGKNKKALAFCIQAEKYL